MRSILFLLSISLMVAGCSKKFSYNNAYKFDRYVTVSKADENVTGLLTFQKEDTQLTASAELLPSAEQARAVMEVSQQRLASDVVPSKKVDYVITPGDTTTNPGANPKAEPIRSRNSAAIAGFFITLVSLPLLGSSLWFLIPLAIGFALCYRGLKSERRKFALVGVWGTIIFLSAILLAALVIRISGGGLDI